MCSLEKLRLASHEKISVGVLTLQRNPTLPFINPSAFYNLFENAESQNVTMFSFTIGDVNIQDKEINATFYDAEGIGYQKKVAYPDIVDNTTRVAKSPEFKDLEKYSIFTRNYTTLSKMDKYKEDLLSNSIFSNMILPQTLINSSEDIVCAFEKMGESIVVKPDLGTEGRDVYRITRKNDRIFCQSDTENMALDNLDLAIFYDNVLSNEQYIAQPFIRSETQDKEPFDIRIFAKRGVDGVFLTGMYVRIGEPGKLTSNLDGGWENRRAENNVEKFLETEFRENANDIMHSLNYIKETFPVYFQTLYEKKLFDIGLDLGIERIESKFRIVLYEINICGVSGRVVPDLNAEASLGYYRYLFNEKRKSDGLSCVKVDSSTEDRGKERLLIPASSTGIGHKLKALLAKSVEVILDRHKSDNMTVDTNNSHTLRSNKMRRDIKQPRFKVIDNIYQNPSSTQSGTAHIMCVGDLMGEPKMQSAAFLNEKFDFRPNFRYVKDILNSADLVLGNLETLVCTSAPYSMDVHEVEENNRKTYRCNSPVEYLDALRYAGFDIFPMSNNHNLDYGIEAIEETLSHVEEYGFGSTGLFLPNQRKKRYLLVTVNGIRLGIFSYSTWFNRKENELSKESQEATINIYSQERVREDIAAAKKDGAEFILIYMHWGEESEYSHIVGAKQIKIAQELVDVGADYIVGSHPHALQKYEVICSSDGREVPVVYSLGNFLTSDGNFITRKNIILSFSLTRKNDKIEIMDECYIPCYVANAFREERFVIVPSMNELNGGLNKAFLEEANDLAANVFKEKLKPYGAISKSRILVANQTLHIRQPKVTTIGNKSRLSAIIDMSGMEKELWIEVDKKWGEYLCHERSDAFLLGVIHFAMRNGYDIVCDAPVSEELLYNVTEHLIPILHKTAKNWHYPKISATSTSKSLKNAGAVGTAISGGVDSFHALINHHDPKETFKPAVTHLIIGNLGNYHDYKTYGKEQIKDDSTKLAKVVAKAFNLPLIVLDSNITDAIRGAYHYSFKTAFSIYAMQKLYKTYLYASSYDYTYFSLTDHGTKYGFFYDLLTVDFFSTRQLRIYSEGGAFDRVQKTLRISDNPVAQEHLLVCFSEGKNCGRCAKCRRTMLTLDMHGKLENFRKSFPVDYFKDNVEEYLYWFGKAVVNGDPFANEMYLHVCDGMYSKYANKIKEIVATFEKNKPENSSKTIWST